jgi:4-amino-4-deoxy-L-arabinose transferase-like glycosyltransferase
LSDYNLQTRPVRVQQDRPSGPTRIAISVLAKLGVLILVGAATLGAIWGGPQLGDHEAIVAECARNMRLTSDWLVPSFLDTAWMRKPPLPYWLVAAASYLFPNDPELDLPVTTEAARLPTAVSALLTILMLWHLASSMFGKCAGMVTAVVASSSILFLLYSANATAEMLLTFCCTWAFLHFWHAVTTRRGWVRFVHMMLFYIALGAGMLAKGPMPMVMVGLPLAVWWYTERPLRLLACLGLSGWRQVLACFGRQIPRQTARAFTHLYIVPGLILFAAIFIPWMVAVGREFPHAWNIWNWQYFQRAQNNYEDTRVRGPFYYLPVMIGLVLPWVFLLAEAVAAPWLNRYARQRRALLFAGLWVLIGLLGMSVFAFKKPYYILPAVPGLLLMIGLVAERFYAFIPTTIPVKMNLWFGRWHQAVIQDPLRFAWITWAIVSVTGILMLIFGNYWMRQHLPNSAMALTVIAGGMLVVFMWAGLVYVLGRGWWALALTAVTTIGAFHCVWYLCGPSLTAESSDRVKMLDAALDHAGVPADANIYWADSRPDARLSFYYGRRPRYTLTPEEIVEFIGVNRTKPGFKDLLKAHGRERAASMLRGPETVYLLASFEEYEEARNAIKGVTFHDIARVRCDPGKPHKDWMVVSNRPPAKTATQPASQPSTRPQS